MGGAARLAAGRGRTGIPLDVVYAPRPRGNMVVGSGSLVWVVRTQPLYREIIGVGHKWETTAVSGSEGQLKGNTHLRRMVCPSLRLSGFQVVFQWSNSRINTRHGHHMPLYPPQHKPRTISRPTLFGSQMHLATKQHGPADATWLVARWRETI